MKNLNFLMTLMFLPLMVKAQELEPNGNFDNDNINWHCGSVNPTWISNDGSTLSGNGSLQHNIIGTSSTGGSLSGGYCDFSTASAGMRYNFKGSYKLLNADEVSNLVIDVYFYTIDANFIDVISETIPINSITLNEWTSFNTTALAPTNTGNIISSLKYEFNNTGNPIDLLIRWDDMSLKQEISVIFSNGFE